MSGSRILASDVQSPDVPGPDYRFGSFLVDRTRYRVSRGDATIELTPKLLDLLLHLLDHAGALVTKEQLLDALWPDANVTDNALAQAMSELRQALGDNAGTPLFIKTVARRGYRFIAPVTRLEGTRPAPAGVTPRADPLADDDRSIFVMDFINVTGDEDAAWLSAGIAETVTADLRATGLFRVVDRGRVKAALRSTDQSPESVCADLHCQLAVAGSFQRHGDRIRITARIIDPRTGDSNAHAKVDGPFTDIFNLQDEVVRQFSKELGLETSHASARTTAGSRETPSLEAYRAHTEAWLRLETLDLREIPQAIAGFERALAIDGHYGSAYTGLASAELAAYEATRCESAPARDLLDRAIAHARKAAALDAAHAEAHATLALVLVSAWNTDEAVHVARRAVALEPANWRHYFRLGHASWGDERLNAAERTLALYPDFAFTHFQTAMVHVARGQLRTAETVLRQGAAVQDRQMARGDRYPALGLHWLLAMVRLAQGDPDEALREFDMERRVAEPHRIYGREYQASAAHGRGTCFIRLGRPADAIEAFSDALAIYPAHAQSLLGLVIAHQATRSSTAAAAARTRLDAAVDRLAATRPIEAALVNGQMLATEHRADDACAVLCAMLDQAPVGFAGWTLPIEPFLQQLIDTPSLRPAIKRLAERAT